MLLTSVLFFYYNLVESIFGICWLDRIFYYAVCLFVIYILTFYRNAIQLRNRFPEIGRGVMTPHGLTSDNKIKTQASILAVGSSLNSTNSLNSSVAVYTLTWKNRTILIVHNTGTASVTLDTSEFAGYKLVGNLKANGGDVKLNDSTLTMSPATVALLHI